MVLVGITQGADGCGRLRLFGDAAGFLPADSSVSSLLVRLGKADTRQSESSLLLNLTAWVDIAKLKQMRQRFTVKNDVGSEHEIQNLRETSST